MIGVARRRARANIGRVRQLIVLGVVAGLAADARAGGTVVLALPVPAPLVPVIPEQGVYIASKSEATVADDVFFIARLDRAGLHEVYRDKTHQVADLAWANATTLVAVDEVGGYGDDTQITVFTMRGTAPPKSETVTIPLATWRLRGDEELALDGVLHATRTGEVWLGACVKEDDDLKCLRKRWLRVYGGAPAIQSYKPGNERHNVVADIDIEPPLTSLRAVPPPPGYSVAVKANGFVCKSPLKTHTSPDDDDLPDTWRTKRVQWVLSHPPVFGIAGEVEALGEYEPYTEFRLACSAQPMAGFRLLRPRIWAQHVTIPASAGGPSEEWQVWIDGTPIGAVGGHLWSIAISP